jgi:hypothetical protein
LIGAHASNDRTQFLFEALGKIHRRITLEEFRLSLFVYRPSSRIELTGNPVLREPRQIFTRLRGRQRGNDGVLTPPPMSSLLNDPR